METVLIIVAILALIGGSAALLSRQGWPPLALPVFRQLGREENFKLAGQNAADEANGTTREPEPIVPAIAPEPPPSAVSTVTSAYAREPIRLDLVPTASDTGARLDRIELRLNELQRGIAMQNDHIAEAFRQMREESGRRAEAEEARREAAQERMRADVLALVSRVVVERQTGSNVRRMEVSAELYAQLARLEAALATVTNPMLLPGEPYSPPAELTPESLVWENWNEVGERAFALAEIYSAQRLHLSAQTRSDVGAFVTMLRTLLTRSVYPNLRAEPDSGRQVGLRIALAEIAEELPKIRDVLETEYLEGRTG